MGILNWAGNIEFRARRLHRPSSVDELRKLVAGLGRVRALGTGHSFNRIADTDGDLVSLAGLPAVTSVDPGGAVTVSAGLRYGEITPTLHAAGWALANLGSLPHISVAGACATGTHGSGVGHGNLATAVAALEMVTADGDLVRLDRTSAGFDGAVVALGSLGIVTSLTLDLVPAFQMRQYVYEGLSLAALGEHLDEVLSAGYSVSLFTDWTGPVVNQVWVKRRAEDPPPPPSWLDARLADGPRHPVPGLPVENCTEQLGVPGPWFQRLPHFRLEFTPSSGDELQSEYFVARPDGVEALTALDAIRDRIAPALQISEVRTVAADRLWLSEAHGRDSLALHFTWVADPTVVMPAVAAVEERLVPLGARPHWGKVFGLDPGAVGRLYPRRDDFRALAREYDPDGKFGNELVEAGLVG